MVAQIHSIRLCHTVRCLKVKIYPPIFPMCWFRIFIFVLASSSSDISIPTTPLPKIKEQVISTSPNPEDESFVNSKKKSRSAADLDLNTIDEISKQIPSQVHYFQRKQKRGGTIDVWWLYDDGGNFYTTKSVVVYI